MSRRLNRFNLIDTKYLKYALFKRCDSNEMIKQYREYYDGKKPCGGNLSIQIKLVFK